MKTTKIFKILLFLSFSIIPNFAFSQTKISIGSGLIASQIEGKIQYSRLENGHPKEGYKNYSPFVGFSYELHFDEHFFLSGTANYTTFNIPFSISSFDEAPFQLKYNHLTTSILLNFELYEHNKNEKQIWNLYFGAGANVNHFRDFRISSIFFSPDDELGKEANRREFGIIYNVALEYKNFKIAFNQSIGQKLYEGMRDNNIESSNWYSLSTSYVFILND